MQSIIGKYFKGWFRKGSTSVAKDALYFEFNEAFGSKECAVCQILNRYEQQYLQTLFYEAINDSSLRLQFKNASGLCSLHTQKILQTGDILGLSILSADLLQTWLLDLERSVDKVCWLCEQRTQNEIRLIGAFVRYWHLTEFRAGFNKSNGLCKNHFRQIIRIMDDRALAMQFRQMELEKIQTLVGHMHQIIRKHDYRYRQETISQEETEAVKRAWRFLA